MIRSALTALLFLVPVTAHAADKALLLNDNEQAIFRQILDAATKAGGIQAAPYTVYFLNKLDAAPAVVPHKDEPAPAPPPHKDEPPADD
jgi:hypothetical protein